MSKHTLLILAILYSKAIFAQQRAGWIVKTNVLNLVAKRPTLSLEKTFADLYGLEAAYTSGELTNFGYRDYYHYDGFLLRAKKYIRPVKNKEANAFYGAYFGNLNQTVVSHGKVDNTGFFSWGHDRDFKANSLRYGGTFGVSFIPGKHFLLEGITGLGYGDYYHVQNNLQNKLPGGYFDFQLWLSIGYSF
ncbi:hypothetical protein [Pedobacter sp. KLB.chiD]|uniref:hypothetical protein n=1 Tax=Pedobacter sp. KLB.chiD TaxID=3387402 RepID=UPI00399B8408